MIDLVKHENESLYVEIVQSISIRKEKEEEEVQSIKINSSVLPELIKVLQGYQEKINRTKNENQEESVIINNSKHITTIKSNRFTEEQKDELQKRYLKGVSLKDLVIQFRQKKEVIEMVLRNRNIEIVSNKQSIRKYWKKSWRKRK